MLVKVLILLTIVIINILLFLYYKKIKKPKKEGLQPCKFNISGLKTVLCKKTGRKYARFRVDLGDQNIFLRKFPILFKFHSKYRFKSHIKIEYSVLKSSDKEEILNKVIEFETSSKEHYYELDDFIFGQIYITLMSDSEYGEPIITFEILENNYCKLVKDQKLTIDFSKI